MQCNAFSGEKQCCFRGRKYLKRVQAEALNSESEKKYQSMRRRSYERYLKTNCRRRLESHALSPEKVGAKAVFSATPPFPPSFPGLQILIVAFQSIGHVIQLTVGERRELKINDFSERTRVCAAAADRSSGVIAGRVTKLIGERCLSDNRNVLSEDLFFRRRQRGVLLCSLCWGSGRMMFAIGSFMTSNYVTGG